MYNTGNVLVPAVEGVLRLIYPSTTTKARDAFKASLTPEQKKVYKKIIADLLNEFNPPIPNTTVQPTLNIVFRKPQSWEELAIKINAIPCLPSDLLWKDQLIGFITSIIFHVNRINKKFELETQRLEQLKRAYSDKQKINSDHQLQVIRADIACIEDTVLRIYKNFDAHLLTRPDSFAHIEKHFRLNFYSFMLFTLWKEVSPTAHKWPLHSNNRHVPPSSPDPTSKDLFYVRVKPEAAPEQLPQSIIAHFVVKETDYWTESVGEHVLRKTRKIELTENPKRKITHLKSKRDSAPSLLLTEKMPGISVEDEEYDFMYKMASWAVDKVNEKLGYVTSLQAALKEMRKSPKPKDD